VDAWALLQPAGNKSLLRILSSREHVAYFSNGDFVFDLGTTLDSLHTYTIVGLDCNVSFFSGKTPTTTIAACFEINCRIDPAECGRVTANLESYRAGVESFSELPPFLEADLENLDDGSVARDFDSGDRDRDVADQATGTSIKKLRQAVVTFQDRPVGPTYRSKGRGSTRTAMNELLGAGTDGNTAPQEMSHVRNRTPKCGRPPPPPQRRGGAHPVTLLRLVFYRSNIEKTT
jgi:hypothetical protein